ncbi:MAG: hypothetical protein WBC74_04555 [Candidatus Omnitrophota bacterium]
MRKTIITILLLTVSLVTYSYGLSDTDFVAAKSKLLYAYKTLESNALQISLTYEQEAAKMPQVEQGNILLLRSDLELGMLVVKEVLALYTLQGVQVSTPPEAAKLLTDASLDSLDFLNRLEERLKIRVAGISSATIRNIATESLSAIEEAKKAIPVLNKFLSQKSAS